MSFLLDSFLPEEIRTRYKEPYFAAGINSRFGISNTRGTYRGFYLTSNISQDNTVTVAADERNSDHSLVYINDTKHALTIRRSDGDFDIDLTSIVDVIEKEWIICMFATYAIGTESNAELRAYEINPVDEFTIASEFSELVVLGTVRVPASSAAPLPIDNVSSRLRTMAWTTQSTDALSWVPMVHNSSFGMSDSEIPYWEVSGSWDTSAVDPRTGPRSASYSGGLVVSSSSIQQQIGLNIEDNTVLRGLLYKKCLSPAVNGIGQIDLVFKDANGSLVSTISTTFDLLSTDSDYVNVDFSTKIPNDSAYLEKIEIQVIGGLWAIAASDVLLIDDVQVWVPGVSGSVRGHKSSLEGSALKITGNTTGDADADAEHPRIYAEADSARLVLMYQSDTISGKAYRVYHQGGPKVWHTVNAVYDNLTGMWSKDVVGEESIAYLQSKEVEAFKVLRTLSATNSWLLDNWDAPELMELSPSSLELFGEGISIYSGVNWGSGVPAFEWSSGSNTRYYVDWLGFEPGQLLRFDQDFEHSELGLTTQGDKRWTQFSASLVDSVSWPGRALKTSTNNGNGGCSSSELWRWGAAAVLGTPRASESVAFSLKWRAKIASEDSNTTYSIGINSNIDYTVQQKGYWFEARNIGPLSEWTCNSGGEDNGFTESSDSGIVAVVNQVYSFRLDVYGSNLGYKSVFFIDGVEVANHSDLEGLIVSNDPARIVMTSNTPNGSSSLEIGFVTMQYYLPFSGENWSTK